jgi:hypothetical protein
MALNIKTKLVDCFLIHNKPLFAFEKAIEHGVRTYCATVLAITHAELERVLLELRVTVIFDDLLSLIRINFLPQRFHLGYPIKASHII